MPMTIDKALSPSDFADLMVQEVEKGIWASGNVIAHKELVKYALRKLADTWEIPALRDNANLMANDLMQFIREGR